MKFNAKKLLLTGTAIVAASVLSTQAHAAAQTLTSAGTWASAGTHGGTSTGTASDAAANDPINTATFLLTVKNDGTANDGSGLNTFNIGAITGTTGGVTTTTGGQGAANPNITVNIASITQSGAAPITVTNVDGDDAANITTVTGGLSTAGSVAVTNNESSTADDVTLNVGGAYSAGTTTTITAGSFAGASANMSIVGNSTFTGALALNAGAGLGSDANLTLSGGTNTITGNTTLNDGAAGLATLTVNGTAIQTVSGTIDGSGGEGTLVVSNTTGGATFAGNIGATGTGLKQITLSGAGGSTFSGTVKAVNIDVNNTAINNFNGASLTAGTGDLNFGADGTVAFGDTMATVTGAITTTTNNTGTLTFADTGSGTTVVNTVGASGHALKAVTLTGAAGVVNFTSLVNAQSINVNSTGTINLNGAGANAGATNFGADGTLGLAAGANLTGAITTTTTNTGTVTLAGASTITGTVGGTGKLIKAINAGAAGTTSTITGNVTATTTTVTGAAGVLNLNGATNTTAVNFAADGTLALGSGASLTGATTTATTNTGTLTLGAGTHTVTGLVGVSAGNVLKVVNANTANSTNTFTTGVSATTINTGAAGSTTNFNGNVTSTNVAVSGTGIVNYNGTTNTGTNTFAANGTINVGAGNTIGAVDSSVAGSGKLVFAGAATTGAISATQRLNTITLASTAQTTVGTGAVTLANTTNLGGNILSSTGVVTAANGQTIGATITGGNAAAGAAATTTYGHINMTGTAAIAATTKVAVNVSTGGYIATGSTYNILNATAGTGVNHLTAGNITDNSYILDFAQQGAGTTEDLVLIATRTNSLGSTGTGGAADNSNNANVGRVLESTAVSGSTNPEFVAIQNGFNGDSSRDQVNERLESLQPTVDGSNVQGAMDATNNVFGVTQMRLASLQQGQSSGMAAGDMMTGSHSWGQIFGQSANQDVRDGIDGYDSKTYGAAVGGDVDAFSGRGHIGAALSYARTNADSDNANSTETDINSYQATLYGDMGLQDDMYLKGMAAYAFNDNNTTRHNVGGIAGLTADGDFNSNQFAARAELGRPFAMQQGFVLTPTLLADYAYYNAESYTESGAGGANLNVNQDSLNKFDVGIGLAASTRLQDNAGGTWKPGISATYKYDLVGDSIQDTSSFTGGGAAFNTQGADPARSQFAVGANVKYMTVNNWDFSAEYNYEFKSDYDAHDGILRAGYKF